MVFASILGVAPVSYTHLDVYKRQEHILLGLIKEGSGVAAAALVSMGGAPKASIFMGKGDNEQAEKVDVYKRQLHFCHL